MQSGEIHRQQAKQIPASPQRASGGEGTRVLRQHSQVSWFLGNKMFEQSEPFIALIDCRFHRNIKLEFCFASSQ